MTKESTPSQFSPRICKSCKLPNCCEIEPPFLTEHDIAPIENATGMPLSEFAEARVGPSGKTFMQMKTKNEKCIFYSEQTRRCSIYENRPIDCRLFPLDVDFRDGKFVWIIYKSCPVKDPINQTEAEEALKIAEAELLPQLLSQIDTYAGIDVQLFTDGMWRVVRDLNLKDDGK
jgi:Fe-S-cluster containining protein